MAKREKKQKDQWDQVLDQIDFKGLTREEVLGQDGLAKRLTGRLLQRVLEAEMDGHPGYQKHDNAGDNSGDSRNGYSQKTVLTENQEMTLPIPRDRNGTFEPAILPKYQKRVPLFNDQVISMYSLGMADRDIRNHIKKIYNVDVSPELISNITNAVMEDVREWQNRPLESSYAGCTSDDPELEKKEPEKYLFLRRYVHYYDVKYDTEIIAQRAQKGFELFGKYFLNLWD
jgi:transposase-like protein